MSGIGLSDEQRAEAVRLRAQASQAVETWREALYASELVEAHGFYEAQQAVMRAAREAEQAEAGETADSEA